MYFDNRIKLDALQERTTYTNDYKRYKGAQRFIVTYQKDRDEPKEKTPPEPRIIDQESYVPFLKEINVPFNLLWQPKDITQTHPATPFEQIIEPPDLGKDEAIRTRPRVFMSPAISLDDVPERQMRDILIKAMYTTDWRKAEEEAVSTFIQKKKPVQNTTLEPPGNNVRYVPMSAILPSSESVNRRATAWNYEQDVGLTDPDRAFWVNKDPPVQCGACVDPLKGLVSPETKQEIADLVENELLRYPHDKVKPGYTGYMPELPASVPLRQEYLPVTHPMVTIQQSIEKRWDATCEDCQ